MIIHNERDLDLDLLLRNLEQMNKIGGKLLPDKLFTDILDLTKECKRQEDKNKRKGTRVLNCDDYIIENISDIIMYAKVHKLDDEEDIQDMKICINNVKNPTIERITSNWGKDTNKIIISVNGKELKLNMYYD